MKIGNIEIDGKVFLAPMAGITDLAFRSLCKRMGAAVVYSEMVSAKGLFYNGKNTESLLKTNDNERPFAVQIFGREPELMAEMAKKLEQTGVEIIDINMGCPAPKIVRNSEGSALMREPELIGRIVSSVSNAVNIPVTVKMRKGFDFQNVNAVECAKIAEEGGAAAIAVHGRTRTQYYSGEADWQIIADVKKAVKIPVIGNGDIVSGETAETMLAETGCDFVMVGRASCGNPWIFREINHFLNMGSHIKKPSIGEKKKAIIEHATALCEIRGEKMAVLEMRKHLCWYVKGIKGAGQLRTNINAINTISDIDCILEYLEN